MWKIKNIITQIVQYKPILQVLFIFVVLGLSALATVQAYKSYTHVKYKLAYNTGTAHNMLFSTSLYSIYHYVSDVINKMKLYLYVVVIIIIIMVLRHCWNCEINIKMKLHNEHF